MGKKSFLFALILVLFCAIGFAQGYNDDQIDIQSTYILLKVDGIPGESLFNGHQGEIDLLTWSWGMSQSESTQVGRGGGAGKAEIENLAVTKYVDKASAYLMLACLKGEHIPEATITIRKSGEDGSFVYIVIRMTDVVVTSVAMGANGNFGRTTETVSLYFSKVNFSYTPQKADGTGLAPIDFTWNILRNQPE